MVFEEPEKTILSGHVEGHRIEELHSHLMVEVKSASDPTKVESVFPLPLSNFFQVKDLPKGKHLLQLKSSLPSSSYKFRSEIIEVDLEKSPQIHVGPLWYSVQEDHHKQVQNFINKCNSFFSELYKVHFFTWFTSMTFFSILTGINYCPCVTSCCWSFSDSSIY